MTREHAYRITFTGRTPRESRGIYQAQHSSRVSGPVGTPIAWHVHNHGKNSYHLLDLVVRPLVVQRQRRNFLLNKVFCNHQIQKLMHRFMKVNK